MNNLDTVPVRYHPEAAHAASEIGDDDDLDQIEGAGAITVPLLVGALVAVCYALASVLPSVWP